MRGRLSLIAIVVILAGMRPLLAQQPIICEPLRYFNPAGMEYIYTSTMPTEWFAVRMSVEYAVDVDSAFVAFGVNRGSTSGVTPDTLDVRILKDALPQQQILDNMTVVIPPNIQGKVPDAYYLVEFVFVSPVARINPPADFWLTWRIRGPVGDHARIRLKGPALNPRRSIVIHSTGDTTLMTNYVRTQLSLGRFDSVDLWAETRVCYPFGKPVELSSFSASYSGGKALLEWNTATEENNRGFEILRQSTASDGGELRLWQRIGFVDGHGTTTKMQHYQFFDPHPEYAVQNDGLVRYRLRQIDYDGTTEMSPVASIRVPVAGGLSMEQNYPNPAGLSSGHTTVSFNLPESADIRLEMCNALGRILHTAAEGSFGAGRHFVEIPLDGLHTGTYFYRLLTGGNVIVRRMTVVQ